LFDKKPLALSCCPLFLLQSGFPKLPFQIDRFELSNFFKISTVPGLNRKVLDTFLSSKDFDLPSRNRMENQGLIFSMDIP
jgi:hypothetical protein